MKKTKTLSSFRLDEVTKKRIKEIADTLRYSEADVIQILVDQYYKHQTINTPDDKSYNYKLLPFYLYNERVTKAIGNESDIEYVYSGNY